MSEQPQPITPQGGEIPAEAPKPPRVIYATYTGAGYSGYLAGLPAVDMTRQEWDDADEKLKALALELRLYTLADQPAAPAAPVETEREP